MRYFGPCSEQKIAETLEDRTVRDWEKRRLTLAAALR
jgi:hypothetical protein